MVKNASGAARAGVSAGSIICSWRFLVRIFIAVDLKTQERNLKKFSRCYTERMVMSYYSRQTEEPFLARVAALAIFSHCKVMLVLVFKV